MDIDRFYRRIGIDEPKHLDIRAVAFEMGLEVQIAPLVTCEARIIGAGNHGIITVRQGTHRLRQRFSIAHEIGHWVYHRGKALVCRQSDIGEGWEIARHREKVADDFASRLLLPDFLIEPRARLIRRLTFAEVAKLGAEFRVSKTATARRLVEMNLFPCLLVGYGRRGRRWFTKSKMVPEHWFPNLDLDAESDALRCVFGGEELGRPTKIGADAFFDRWDADRYEMLEETISVGQQDVVTILTLTDERMLEDE
jgi:hypothetical protein